MKNFEAHMHDQVSGLFAESRHRKTNQTQDLIQNEFDKSKSQYLISSLHKYDNISFLLDFKQIDSKLQNMMNFMHEFFSSYQVSVGRKF